ncbi:TPA: hypothetical protein SMI23_001805 [Serratia marcescens]|nr:hypothetical protein [Serratia marcescens]
MKEELNGLANHIASAKGGLPQEWQDWAEEIEADIRKLANREAQPVAWEMRYWNSGHNCWHDWERITAEQHAEMSVKYAADNDYEFRVLYDAPPAPKSTNAAGWGINMQTGTPILVYKNCSVIESEQAHYVLSLINGAATPAPAVPDIGSPVVNDAAWKLHDTLTEYGPLNGHQFNNLKGCLYEALKIVMTAPPAPAVVKLPTEFYSDEGIVVRLEEVMAALAVAGVQYERKANAKTRCEFPASEVPEEMTGGIAMSKYKVKKSNYAQWVKGWNACRAAMLAAAPEGGNG